MPCIQADTIYYFTNVKGGTCVDIHGGDNVSIIGHGYNGGSNQKWTFQSAGGEKVYYIKSVGGNQYLSVDGEPRNGQKLVASSKPYAWRIEEEDESQFPGIRLFSGDNVNYCIDLADHGNSKWGTQVQLWGRWHGENQIWKLHKAQ